MRASDERPLVSSSDIPARPGRVFHELATWIHVTAASGIPRADFVHAVLVVLQERSGCALVELQLDSGALYRVERTDSGGNEFCILAAAAAPPSHVDAVGRVLSLDVASGSGHQGVLRLEDPACAVFQDDDLELYGRLSRSLGEALVVQQGQAALRERVKELTCLYQVAQLIERTDVPPEALLGEIVAVLPPAWQYPDVAAARLVLDGRSFATQAFREDASTCQSAVIVVGGTERGVLEVCYTAERPTVDEGPFLREERSLLETVALEVARLVERRQAMESNLRLQGQLRHADRLATIGQLAAGVAHELNEPLGSVLGFAQLARKCPGLPQAADDDIGKIVEAALHAREIIRRLLLFARQKPPARSLVSVNQVVEDGLYFMESRAGKEGICIVRDLTADMPMIIADASQLHQMLVNLVVNAVQAMPRGGMLTLRTRAAGDDVVLEVEDTGVGMDENTLEKLFVPFFTTKDIGQGTGLGLSVVHGIVTAHGGRIRVQSEVGRGTCFAIHLPVRAVESVEGEQGDTSK